MGFPRAENKGGGELPPEGTHVARCYRLVDLGTQYSERFKTQARKIIIGWELPAATMEDGRPFAINKWYTLSWHKKSNLRKDLQSWRGRPFEGDDEQYFDLTKIVGQACLLNIIHEKNNEGEIRARVQSIMALPAGHANTPAAVNPPFIFSLDEFDPKAFDSLHEATQDIIKQSLEYKAMGSQPATDGPPPAGPDWEDDDIPWG